MSTPFARTHSLSPIPGQGAARHPQFNSWLAWLDRWLRQNERRRQQDALRDIADDPHLLDDLGLTRDDVLKLTDRPFRP